MRHLLSSILVVLLSACGAVTLSSTPQQRPNIVVILFDDLRWDALGCVGHPFVKTPNIDRIAQHGAIMANTFVTTPLCSPSRGSFLTGQYVHTHGIIDNTARNGHKLDTYARTLQQAGYENAFVGKWHMGNDDTPRPGFDYWAGLKGQSVYQNPTVNLNGTVIKENGYVTDILTSYTLGFLRQPHEKPFTLWLGEKAVHGPFKPAERHKDLYTTAVATHRPNTQDQLMDKPALRQRTNKSMAKAPFGATSVTAELLKEPGSELMRNQLRCVASVDEAVGQIVQALKEAGQLDHTLIIVTSDNGYLWGEHSLGDKRAAFDESIRIPMVMSYPPLIKPGSKIEQMVLNIDIAPTILALARTGATSEQSTIISSAMGRMQGESMLPLFTGKAPKWRDQFLIEYKMEQQYPRVPTWVGIRTEGEKYVRYEEFPDMDEFYDLKADPYEMKNLVNDPAAKQQLELTRGKLEKLLKTTGAGTTTSAVR